MDDARWPDEMRRLLTVVLARGRALPGGDFDAWLAEAAPARESRVVRERLASGTDAYELDVADALRPDGDVWFDVEPDAGRWVRVGYDTEGALAVATMDDAGSSSSVVAVGESDADGTEWVTGRWPWNTPRVAARRTLGDGTVVVVSATWAGGVEEAPEVIVSATARSATGRARMLRAQMLTSHDGESPGRVVAGVDELRFDETGRPVERWIDRTARWDAEAGEQTDDVAPSAARTTDPLALLEPTIDALRDRAATATPVLWWSARLHDPPSLAADPTDRFDDAEVERAAIGLRDALVAAAATSTLSTPCAVCLGWKTGETRRPAAMPDLVLVDRAFRSAFARRPSDHHALNRTHDALEAGEAQRFALGPFADDKTVDMWRRLQRAYGDLPGVTREQQEHAAQDLARVRRRALALLLGHRWPSHWDDSVVPWMHFGPPHGAEPTGSASVDPRAELGELDPAAAELERLWPTRAPVAETDWSNFDADDGEDPDPALVDSREALRELFEREGLGEAASALAGAARWGWELRADDDAAARRDDPGRTRIGGRPLLPPGTPWPATAGNEPLTFVAAIDLGSLPPLPEPVVLPADGLLLFYVLVGETDRDDGMLDFLEHEPVTETARVFHVPAGTDPVEADIPVQPLMLRQEYGHPADTPVDRRLSPRPVLMPVNDLGVRERFGLHRSAVDRYDEVVWALRGNGAGDDARAIGTLLGAEAGPQGHGEADDALVLLAINGDADVGLDWGDAGDLRVLIAREAAESGRWDQAYAVGDCG